MEPPPSYDYVAQVTGSYDTGLYSDASADSFQRAEQFVAANLHLIDTPPPQHICQDILRSSLRTMQTLDLAQSTKDVVLIETATSAVFHPKLRPRFGRSQHRPQGDTDVCIQGLYPMLGIPQLKSYAQVKAAYDGGAPPEYGEEVHYFEVTISQVAPDVVMAIGLCTRPYPSFRMPGWNRHSIGWHSDDGRKFCDDPDGGEDYSAPWGRQGDVLGCGWQSDNGTVWFTRNGVLIGQAYINLSPHVFFPAFGADGYCKVDFNFGQSPFRYQFLPFQRWLGSYTTQ